MITVSLCMIVKNEEQVLKRCLDSLAGLYDELVIVDTGSTDRTKEIAAGYNAKIYDFKWVDDFSAARNYAFERCSMEYIYSADADEVLDEENRQKFMMLKANLLKEIEMVQMLYVNRHEFSTTENFEKEYRPKLFKRLRTFTWIEPIHEMVNINPVIYDSDIEIFHMPTSLHSSRDLGVFRKAFNEEGVMSKRLMGMYARELIISGTGDDLNLAGDFFENAWYDTVHYDGMQQDCCCVMARIARLNGDDAGFLKWTMRNMTSEPCSEISLEMAIYYYDKGDLFEAIDHCENAINRYSPILDARAGGEKAYLLLADIYDTLSKDENAPAYCDFEEKARECREMANIKA